MQNIKIVTSMKGESIIGVVYEKDWGLKIHEPRLIDYTEGGFEILDEFLGVATDVALPFSNIASVMRPVKDIRDKYRDAVESNDD